MIMDVESMVVAIITRMVEVLVVMALEAGMTNLLDFFNVNLCLTVSHMF